jgi:hypothetical protein
MSSRRRRSRPDRANEDQGLFATEVVAEEYDLELERETADWYDAINPRTGAKTEVKSTHRALEDGSVGRFRLWRDQHRSLRASDASGVAWYAFVLLDDSDSVVDVVRAKPSTVGRLVRESGDWNRAGHSERDGPQHKLPWTEVPRLG